MRRLVLFLFILNGVLLAWFMFQQQQKDQQLEQAKERFDFSSTASVTLLSEVPKSELLQRNKKRIAEEKRKQEAKARQICYWIGPIDDESIAEKIRIRLGYGDDAKIVSDVVALPAMFGVYTQPQATYQAARALAFRLKADGFDSYAVPDGEEENTVALGVFSKLESAQSVLKKGQDKGYEVSIAERKRKKNAYFVALDEAKTLDFDQNIIEKIQVDTPEIKIIEKSCKVLALSESIQ